MLPLEIEQKELAYEKRGDSHEIKEESYQDCAL
jgi:hypothetical protein